MRVTNNMITYNFLISLNKSLERQNQIQEQLSDGKAVHRPSDDPIKTIRSMRFNTSLGMNEQYTQNVKDALSWMEMTDGAMSDLSSAMIKAKELVIKAGSANPEDAYQAIGAELDGLINNMIQIANTQIGERYIFAGQKDKTKPYERSGDTVVYNGDTNTLSFPLQPGAVNALQDGININGSDAFGMTAMFDHLIEIKNQLMTGSPDLNFLGNAALQYIEQDHGRMLKAHTALGARMAQYEMAQNMLENSNILITGDIAANEDIDLSRAIIDFKTSENVYRTALSVGARIMPASLVDFLK